MQRLTNSSRYFRLYEIFPKSFLSTDHSHPYTASTEKKETRVPDDLKGGQPLETIDTNVKITPTLSATSKVW